MKCLTSRIACITHTHTHTHIYIYMHSSTFGKGWVGMSACPLVVLACRESLHVCTVCIWRCEHARFCVEVFYALYINFHSFIHIYICNGAEWSKDKTQAAESIKWRPQQAYGSNQFLLVQPQTVFSTHPKSSRSRIDKRTARATGNTRYHYSKIAPLDHKMADNCVSLARTNTLSLYNN